MKILDTSSATATVGQPVKSGTLQFLQLAYQEGIRAIANQLIGNGYAANTIYVLAGCINSGAGTTLNLTEGWLFVNGLVYYYAGTGGNFTPTGSNVAVSNFNNSQYTTNADPTIFTDGTSHNVHNIVTIVLADASSGSGNVTNSTASDYSNWVRMGGAGMFSNITSTFPSTYTETFTQNKSQFFTTGLTGSSAYVITFNFANAILGTTVMLSVLASSGATLSFTAPSGCTLVNDSGSYTANKTNVIWMVYNGVNANGNNEVHYTVNSY